VPQTLGAHNPRVAAVADLLTKRGRDDRGGAFAFEGATLLDEAARSDVAIRELYVTQAAYDQTALARRLDAGGIPTYVVAERTFAKISGVETPSGILAVADRRLCRLDEAFATPGIVLVLADIGDPGNVGTLLRSAEAFGVAGVVVGNLAADPFQPKVVRAAMGAIFRLTIAVAEPGDFAAAARRAGARVVGLSAGAVPLERSTQPGRLALIVGHERHGLGRWESVCDRLAGIAMTGPAESLNAAVAGSIALYEWSRRPA